MDVKQPIKIIYIKAIVTGSTNRSSKLPGWYHNWYLSAPDSQERYNCKVSPWYDHNSMWIGTQIKFYDLEKYTEFCLQWIN